jgi:hypothetical protein
VVNWCCMSKKSEESMNRLLLYYEVANALWSVIFGCIVCIGFLGLCLDGW